MNAFMIPGSTNLNIIGGAVFGFPLAVLLTTMVKLKTRMSTEITEQNLYSALRSVLLAATLSPKPTCLVWLRNTLLKSSLSVTKY